MKPGEGETDARSSTNGGGGRGGRQEVTFVSLADLGPGSDFAVKAARVLDLYTGIWDGEPLGENEFVICADEKTRRMNS